MLKLMGWTLIAVAAMALVVDWMNSGEGGMTLAPLGQRWAEIHRESLIGLQSGLENRVSGDLFFDHVLPVLELPAAGVAGGLGLALLAASFVLGRLRA